MNIAQMFGFKVTREDLDRERDALHNCFECDAPLYTLCLKCNPSLEFWRGWARGVVFTIGVMMLTYGVIMGAAWLKGFRHMQIIFS